MAISKVVYKSSANATPVVWMDATSATAAAADITSPKTAMLANGVVTTGTGSGGGGGLSWSDVATGAQPSGNIDLGSATSVRDYFMYYNQTANEWTVTGNSVTSVGQNCFRMNTYLKAAYFPVLASMSGSGYLFYGSSTAAQL